MKNNNRILLFVCGMAILFWELALIRWHSSCVRIIGYYTNFVLISTFFGLGLGSLLCSAQFKLYKYSAYILSFTILLSWFLSSYGHFNLQGEGEFTWIGAPIGIRDTSGLGMGTVLPSWIILSLVFFSTTSVFVLLGQWLGELFLQEKRPLIGYSAEIAGSLVGIICFSLLSYFKFGPFAWFVLGFILILVFEKNKPLSFSLKLGSIVATLVIVFGHSEKYVWSNYYKIGLDPITNIETPYKGQEISFDRPMGYSLTVNNDFHQMMLDLSATKKDNFTQSWRDFYDFPYRNEKEIPKGPILIVGAGSGNDVAAALRNTNREIHAVEIDSSIFGLGKKLHAESPYNNKRVKVFIDDARSFFQKTKIKYAHVVFGFLDSHKLLSFFSSLRLDNFVYTQNSIKQVRRILMENGKVSLTFSSLTPWIHQRIIDLLQSVFQDKVYIHVGKSDYTNGVIYSIRIIDKAAVPQYSNSRFLPVDDWPFFYLKEPKIPAHYYPFIAIIIFCAFASFLALPKNQRSIKTPYFFLGAGFFLLETSNVVSLSVLFGSTWVVNIFVFSSILLLILMGNLVIYKFNHINLSMVFMCIIGNLLLAYFIPVSSLLAFTAAPLKLFLAAGIYLGPIFFASLAFGKMIKNETNLAQAYGSNILGAMVGGALEYLSLVSGFKFLLILA